MASSVLHTPSALVEFELRANRGQGNARRVCTGGGKRWSVDQTRVAVAERRADATAANRLKVRCAVRDYCSPVADLTRSILI